MMIRKGFTVVELLIVIVVIGILATLAIMGYNGIQDRARATTITKTIRDIDKAFRLKATADTASTWWIESTFGGSNPSIGNIITNTNLKEYIQRVPTIPGSSIIWQYDNDGDTYGGCSTSGVGINILLIDAVSTTNYQSVLQEVDNTLDDGNLNCGKFRFNSGTGDAYWSLSGVQEI